MPKKNEKNVPIRKFSKKIVYFSIVLLVVLFLFVSILFLNEYGLNISNLLGSKNTVQLSLEDRCAHIAGQLIHTIGDADSCSLSCKSECYTINSKNSRSEFKPGNQSCNLCQCFCN